MDYEYEIGESAIIERFDDDDHEYLIQAREEVCSTCRYSLPDGGCAKIKTRRWKGAVCTEKEAK